MSLAAPLTLGADAAARAPVPQAPPTRRGLRRHILTGLLALVPLGLCAWLGVVKFDEGWYIASSRLAGHGALPYRDFGFTQGPLFAYVLAPSQWVAPGVLSARITSSVCAALGVVLLLATARRLAGTRAAWLTGVLLLGAFPALPYWLSQTKTYGLASLFLAATVAALTSRMHASVRLPLATAMAACFALTRISGATLAVAVFAYCMYSAPDLRTWKRVAGVALAPAGPFLALCWFAGERSLWNLYSYHQMTAYWANTHVSTLSERVSEVFKAWPFVSFLVLLAIGLVLIRRDRPFARLVREHVELVVVAVGLAAFVITHMLGGAFFAEEYVAPLIPTIVMLSVVVVVRLCASIPFADFGALLVVLVFAVGLTPHAGYLGSPGWSGSPQALAPVTRCIDRHSSPGDHVFALVLLEAVPAAHRTPVAGTSLGVFSYEDVSTPRAKYLHILNADLVQQEIASASTGVVVLTSVDRQLLSFRGWFSQSHQDLAPIDRELARSYRPVCTFDLVRELQHQPTQTTVYARVR